MNNVNKLKVYGEDEPIPINRNTIEELTGNSYETWLSLTGLYNVEIEGEIFLTIDDFKIFGTSHSITIDCTKKICLTIMADLKNAIIYFEQIHLWNYEGRGIGTIVHKNQVELAKLIGFKSIVLEARRSLSKDKFFNGYITWAKFGYQMIQDDHELFIEYMKKRGKKVKELVKGKVEEVDVKCIQQLLHRDCLYWKNEGYSWNGIFDLEENSICNRFLKVYLWTPKKYECAHKN